MTSASWTVCALLLAVAVTASWCASPESLPAQLQARVHHCVRGASPGLVIPVGSFAEMAKVESCASKGMKALSANTPAARVRDQITGCVDGATFPDSVKPSVARFQDCIVRALS